MNMVLAEIIKPHLARIQLMHVLLRPRLARTSSVGILCQRCNQRRSYIARGTQVPEWNQKFSLAEPELDLEYLTNPENTEKIHENIRNRKGVGDIHKVISLWDKYKNIQSSDKATIWKQLIDEAKDIPNNSHPSSPLGDEKEARQVQLVGKKREFDFPPKTVVQLGEKLGMLKTENVSMTTGERTYYFKHDLARLEQALIRYTLDNIKAEGFQLLSVPDMIHPALVESCGFKTSGERSQVYKLDPRRHGDICLAGTSEMPLAGFFMNEKMNLADLPSKVTAVSRCYRAETSDVAEEKGIYRVHQFTKVEMFAVTANETGNESEQLVEELLKLQIRLFSDLGLHFRVLDMPTQELGAPAYRKYDIETWMSAKKFWGEISSTSNCTDYQSRRLCIKYRTSDGTRHAHTVNGTACAVPRMIMAIMESNQRKDGTVDIPEVLQPYMNTTVLTKPDNVLRSNWIRLKKLKSRK